MREIIINRPKRFECAANALQVEVNGKKLAKLKNGQRIVISADDGAQSIRVCGGFLCGKAFQDKLDIPAGPFAYTLQVDFITSTSSNYLPRLRPCGGEWVKDDTRTITLMGSTLCKLLLDANLREALRKFPEARLQLVILPTEWKLVLRQGSASKELFRDEYSHAVGGFAAAMVNALEHGDLKTAEGRAKICDKVLTDYACCLPEYVRAGEDCIVFKG